MPKTHGSQNPEFQDWGLIDYQEALEKQIKLVDLMSQDEKHPGFLIFCSHPEVVTTGRQTLTEDIFGWQGPIIEISRGGRATYHGPSQLVIYPILNLKLARKNRGTQEIRGYLRTFEKAIADVLQKYGINAVGRTPQKNEINDTTQDETGVWVGSKKIASLGIAVKKWICFHGAAINIFDDPKAFQGINPCGFKSETMTSVEKVLQKKLSSNDFEIFKEEMKQILFTHL